MFTLFYETKSLFYDEILGLQLFTGRSLPNLESGPSHRVPTVYHSVVGAKVFPSPFILSVYFLSTSIGV
jgi:hypothetical protein